MSRENEIKIELAHDCIILEIVEIVSCCIYYGLVYVVFWFGGAFFGFFFFFEGSDFPDSHYSYLN